MLEDDLEDVENLLSDLETDVVGAKYLKMTNSVLFSDMSSCVIEITSITQIPRDNFIKTFLHNVLSYYI